jgi:hypothetical protein
MANKKVITLGLDYSQLDAGTAEINRKMSLLESQFKLTKEQIKSYGDETDQLALKNDKLTQQIILQSKKVDIAKSSYDKAIEGGKASDKQLDNLNKTYIEAQTKLQKLNNELQDNKSKLDNSNKSAESFGGSIRSLASTMGLNINPAIEGLASKFDGLDKNVGNAILGIGAIGAAFISCTISAANMADDLLQLSSVTGITTDELQKMKYASDFLDVEVSAVTDSMEKMIRNMNRAGETSGQAAEAFQKLHIKTRESNGSLRDANDVFYETIDALGRVKNETERDALAMSVFGRSARDLNPLIEAGSKKLKELGIEAENMGTIMSEDSLQKLGKLKDAMDKFKNTTDAVKNGLGLALLPVLTVLFETISKIPAPVLQTIVVLASIIASIVLVVKAIKSMTDTASTISTFFKGMNAETWKTVGIVLAVVAALIALVAIIAVLAGKSGDLQRSMTTIGSSVNQMTSTINAVPETTAKTVGYANGTKNAPGGWAWKGEAGPELEWTPPGSRV